MTTGTDRGGGHRASGPQQPEEEAPRGGAGWLGWGGDRESDWEVGMDREWKP